MGNPIFLINFAEKSNDRYMTRLWILATAVLFSTVQPAAAQTAEKPRGVAGLLSKLGSLLDTMAVKGVDRNYIEAPKHPWQVILKGNINQSVLKFDSKVDASSMFTDVVSDLFWEPTIKTDPSTYAGVWAGYRGYGIGYSWNVGGDKGSILTFGATGGSYGVNLRIHTFWNDEPEVHYAGSFILNNDPSAQPTYVSQTAKVPLERPIRTRTVLCDAYYMFNGKRFSYAAAYDQSVIQKRSAGSLMVGALFYYSHVNYAEDENADFILLMDNIGRIKQWQVSLGAGYAYNLVPCKGLLISAMAMPMLTVYDRYKTWRFDSNYREMALDNIAHDDDDLPQSEWRLKDEPLSVSDNHSRLTLNVDARLSLTYQWKRFFINAFGQYSRFRYKDGAVKGTLSDWYINAALGVRF